MGTMKAWFANEYGPPNSVLKLETLPKPQPIKNQVLVKILCSSINPIDLRMVQGYGARLRRLAAPTEFPFIMGRDVVGEVTKTGPDSKKFAIGDRVVGITGVGEIGAHAEFSAIDEANLTIAPGDVPSIELAAIPYVGLTTWTALVERLGMKPGEVAGKHLFVQAGSGGIGSFTIQWACALGMAVSTTCSQSNIDWVRELGANTVVDYQKEHFYEVVSNVDYAYDTLGGEYEADTAGLVKRGGGYVSIVHELMPYTDRYGLVLGGLVVGGRFMRKKIWHAIRGRKYAWSICQPNQKGLTHIIDKVATGQIKAVIDKKIPMRDILTGYEHLQTGQAQGKTVLYWD